MIFLHSICFVYGSGPQHFLLLCPVRKFYYDPVPPRIYTLFMDKDVNSYYSFVKERFIFYNIIFKQKSDMYERNMSKINI